MILEIHKNIDTMRRSELELRNYLPHTFLRLFLGILPYTLHQNSRKLITKDFRINLFFIGIKYNSLVLIFRLQNVALMKVHKQKLVCKMILITHGFLFTFSMGRERTI